MDHLRRGVAVGLLIGSLAVSSAAADISGRWRVDKTGGPVQFVDVVQTGSALSFPYLLPFTGTLTGADYSVSIPSTPMFPCGASITGRVLPSGDTLDGRLVGAALSCFPPTVAAVVATRCTCFDGNANDGDGCSARCQVEPCFTCSGTPSVCTPSPDGAACDGGAVCTTGETCSAGVCGGGSAVVPCVDITGAWHLHAVIPDFSFVIDENQPITQRNTDVIFGGDGAPGFVGTIDPATGAFDVREANTGFTCSFDPLTGTVAPDGNSFSGGGVASASTPMHCVGFDTIVTGTRSTCGNGIIETGETCDDGNQTAGDGCDAACLVETCHQCSGMPSTCTLAPSGSPCDDGDACTANACDGSGACAVTGSVDCDDGNACTVDTCTAQLGCAHTPDVRTCREATSSTLFVRAPADASKRKLAWKWLKGQSTSVAEFADPRSTAAYTFCLFAGATSVVVGDAVVPPDAQHWTEIGSSGFKFKDPSGGAGGIRHVLLRGSDANRTKIVLKGKGTALSLAAPPTLPLRAQLSNGDTNVCWSAQYDTADVVHTLPDGLRAKHTSP